MVMIDGLSVGNEPVEEMIATGVAQSVHAYRPAQISHFRASWVDRNSSFPKPTWPLLNSNGTVKLDRAGLERHYAPWAELARKGVGVHCGECGGYNKTPHDIFLAWMTDVLEILKGHGIGFALWNFRGSFGILDSERQDVAYEDWHGHKLDRKLLALLQRS
jgi:aryl-phospho-beta-D-glucosidase BglC (GH1 family)